MGMKQAFGKDSLVAQTVKHLPAMEETQAWSLGREDPLEKEMATHSSTLAWKTPWMEESGRLQSMGSQRVREDWATSLSLWGRKDASVNQSHRKKINVDQMHTEENKFTKISLFIGGLDGKLEATETQADSKQPLLDSSFVSSLSQLTLNYCPWPPLRGLSLRPISRTSPISNLCSPEAMPSSCLAWCGRTGSRHGIFWRSELLSSRLRRPVLQMAGGSGSAQVSQWPTVNIPSPSSLPPACFITSLRVRLIFRNGRSAPGRQAAESCPPLRASPGPKTHAHKRQTHAPGGWLGSGPAQIRENVSPLKNLPVMWFYFWKWIQPWKILTPATQTSGHWPHLIAQMYF